MEKSNWAVYFSKDIILLLISPLVILSFAFLLVFLFFYPAPRKKFVMATGEEEGNYHHFEKKYQEQIKAEGIDMELRPSDGGLDNLAMLSDPKSDVDVGFVQDGLGSRKDNPGLSSLGSVF